MDSRDAQLRPMVDADDTKLRALLEASVAAEVDREGPRYFLQIAFPPGNPESDAIVAENADGIVGFVLFGAIAGAAGTSRIHCAIVHDSFRHLGLDVALVRAAVARLSETGTRLVIAEIPNADGRLVQDRLHSCGFRETGRIADYYRDGVDLIILALRIDRDA